MLLLATAFAVPAAAVVGGTVDSGNQFPAVGLLYFTQPDGRFRCSGTLIAPDVMLTAAHCTQSSTNVLVTFDPAAGADPLTQGGDPSRFVSGTAVAHPDFNEKLQLKDLLDVGVVLFDSTQAARIATLWPAADPVPLPPAGYLTQRAAKGGLKGVAFTVAGYGVFYENGAGPPAITSDKLRRSTTAGLQNINGETVKLQESAGNANFGGGTCSGDSGGPLLLDGFVVGDTSWGSSQWCAGGAGGYQRTDTPDARAFLAEFVDLP
jgi:hypothetical protein